MNDINYNKKILNYNIFTVPPYSIKNKYISEISRYFPPDFIKGLWVTTKDEKYSTRVLENATQPRLSPDLNKILYVKIRQVANNIFTTDIHIASLVKSPETKRKYYEIEIGRNQGVIEGDYLLIASPKINPLNNRVIGYKDPVKAIVFIKGVKPETSLVYPEVILSNIEIGDLAAYQGQEKYGLIKAILKNATGYSSSVDMPSNAPASNVISSRSSTQDLVYSETDLINQLKKALYIINGGKNYTIRWVGIPNSADRIKILEYLNNAYEALASADRIAQSLSNDKAIEIIANCQGCLNRDKNSYNRGLGNKDGLRDAQRALKEFLKGK